MYKQSTYWTVIYVYHYTPSFYPSVGWLGYCIIIRTLQKLLDGVQLNLLGGLVMSQEKKYKNPAHAQIKR